MIAKGKAAALAVAVALLAGCAQSPPRYVERQMPVYVPPTWDQQIEEAARQARSRYVPRYVPQETERATPPKTAPVDSGPSASWFPSWRSAPPSAGGCSGWWRICHFL